jgi:hypothetical protein
MKLFLPFLLFLCSTAFAQKLTIKKTVDKMDGAEYYTASKGLKAVKDAKKWFLIEPIIKKNDENKVECTGLFIKFSGIGACNENDVLDFLFEDGNKLKIKAWNQFACKNNSGFFIDSTNALGECLTSIKLLNKAIKSIRFSNGKTYDNLTVDLPPKDKNYFIELNTALNN